MICSTCLRRVESARGYICEVTGRHLYWNKQSCSDHVEAGSSAREEQRKEKQR